MAQSLATMADSFSRLYLTDKAAFYIDKPEEEYVLHIDAQNNAKLGTSAKIAATSTKFMVRIYTCDSLTFSTSIRAHRDVISGVRFSPSDTNALYTSSVDGTVRLWDLRTKCDKACQVFETLADSNKHLSCLDVNCNGQHLCAGTDSSDEEEPRIYLWDNRGAKFPFRHFEDSHNSDVTQVRFHPENHDVMISGATDGLVCYYDLTETDEDDVIMGTMNTESSVNKLGFCGKDKCYIYATTHIETLYLWESKEDFDDIASVTDVKEKYESHGVEYLVDCFQCHWLPNEVCVLTGSNSGQGLVMSLKGGELKPEFSLPEGHTEVIRSATWCSGMSSLVTGGEDAMLCAWSQNEAGTQKSMTSPKSKDKRSSTSELKTKMKHKARHSAKPF